MICRCIRLKEKGVRGVAYAARGSMRSLACLLNLCIGSYSLAFDVHQSPKCQIISAYISSLPMPYATCPIAQTQHLLPALPSPPLRFYPSQPRKREQNSPLLQTRNEIPLWTLGQEAHDAEPRRLLVVPRSRARANGVSQEDLWPVDVACSSGVSARRPMMVILAKEERGVEVENARAPRGRARERRRRKDDMLIWRKLVGGPDSGSWMGDGKW